MYSKRKRCTKCEQTKPVSEFQRNRATADGLQTRCTTCQNTTNRAQQRAKREAVYHYLRRHPCIDCGEADPIVLDFDHVRGVKSLSVGTMISRQKSRAVIAAEIEKCEVRCSNCHRRRTAKSRDWYSGFADFKFGPAPKPDTPIDQQAIAVAERVLAENPNWRTNIKGLLAELQTQVDAELWPIAWSSVRDSVKRRVLELLNPRTNRQEAAE
jgi:hypothetical protein